VWESVDKNGTLPMEEIFNAICAVTGYKLHHHIDKVQAELERVKDPEYTKYLELKAKFEGQ
jgi:hypothetical protein